MYLHCVFICFHVVPLEQERAHNLVLSKSIEYVHCFQQPHHLLMHIDLTGVVARFGLAKRPLTEGVDLKH